MSLCNGAQAARHFVVHRGVRVQHRFLAHVADTRRGLPPHLTVVQIGLSGQHFEQAGFAAAVAADEADALAFIQLEIHVIQQCDMTEGQCGLVQRDIGHLLGYFRLCGLEDEGETERDAAHRQIAERSGEFIQNHMGVVALDAGREQLEHEQAAAQQIGGQHQFVAQQVTVTTRLALRRQSAEQCHTI